MIAPEPSTNDADRATTDGEGREDAWSVPPTSQSGRSEESPVATRLAEAEETAHLRENETRWEGYLD